MKENPQIISGKYKNQKLNVPEVSRPITHRIKISMFDILSEVIPESTFCDIFAGSGSVGIEALSRGAEKVFFVESDETACEIINENIEKIVDVEDRKKIMVKNTTFKKFTNDKKNNSLFDVVFVDPPFKIAERVEYHKIMKITKPQGIIVIRIPTEKETEVKFPPKSFEVLRKEIYGENIVFFIRFQK